jgi:ABC transporter substrate binding protein (PQQ-dependent alcohol dehydrogenase system)
MIRFGALLAGAAVGLMVLTGAAMAANEVKVGYLALEKDPRYQQDVAFSHIALNPVTDAVQGAQMGIADEQIVANAAGFSASLDEQKAADLPGLVAKVRAMAQAGERFIILDLPGDVVDQLAAQTKSLPVTLINATAHDDFLRDRCYPNLLHTAASDRMEADALVQYLRTRNWTKVLVLQGKLPRDQVVADSFKASSSRLRLNIVDTRTFTLSRNPENQEDNNTLLITGNADYDVIFIADSNGEYARYLPYATQLPRPVVGAEGLVPGEWHWSWDRDGATQVTSRFLKRNENTREMTGADWSTWVAAKAVVESYGRAGSNDPSAIDAYLRGPKLRLDGSKGVTLNFRAWDGQLRMPITLSTHSAVITVAPLQGFLHQTNTLDTLGEDQPEHKCQ